MNLLVNFATLKKGGGQNVALNFVHALDVIEASDIKLHFVVVRGSELDRYLRSRGHEPVQYMPYNPLLRMVKEFFLGKNIIRRSKIDVIYSYFGSGLYPSSVPQISGSAESNLYFPELDFWKDYRGLKKMLKAMIDRYRIWGIKRVTAIIFENEVMQQRSEKLYNIRNTTLIRPSITEPETAVAFPLPPKATAARFRGLFFCSWQRNKNFMLIPSLAATFRKYGVDLHFVFTAPPDNSVDHTAFVQQVGELDVADQVSIVGRVKKEEIASLYEQTDVVFLLSKLESFSNNIIESWYFKRPLVIADEPWSRAICGNAAVYVHRDDVEDIYRKTVEILNTPGKWSELIEEGARNLKLYPSVEERARQEIDYITHIWKNA